MYRYREGSSWTRFDHAANRRLSSAWKGEGTKGTVSFSPEYSYETIAVNFEKMTRVSSSGGRKEVGVQVRWVYKYSSTFVVYEVVTK